MAQNIKSYLHLLERSLELLKVNDSSRSGQIKIKKNYEIVFIADVWNKMLFLLLLIFFFFECISGHKMAKSFPYSNLKTNMGVLYETMRATATLDNRFACVTHKAADSQKMEQGLLVTLLHINTLLRVIFLLIPSFLIWQPVILCQVNK